MAYCMIFRDMCILCNNKINIFSLSIILYICHFFCGKNTQILSLAQNTPSVTALKFFLDPLFEISPYLHVSKKFLSHSVLLKIRWWIL
jgi:hypothetical protein